MQQCNQNYHETMSGPVSTFPYYVYLTVVKAREPDMPTVRHELVLEHETTKCGQGGIRHSM